MAFWVQCNYVAVAKFKKKCCVHCGSVRLARDSYGTPHAHPQGLSVSQAASFVRGVALGILTLVLAVVS